MERPVRSGVASVIRDFRSPKNTNALPIKMSGRRFDFFNGLLGVSSVSLRQHVAKPIYKESSITSDELVELYAALVPVAFAALAVPNQHVVAILSGKLVDPKVSCANPAIDQVLLESCHVLVNGGRSHRLFGGERHVEFDERERRRHESKALEPFADGRAESFFHRASGGVHR